MRRMKNKKIKSILSITGYFLLVIALCFSVSLVFHNLYYESIYVSGGSMSPTLNNHINEDGENTDTEGTLVDFGILDAHKSAINHVKRFSIISTFYYDDYETNGALKANSRKKIKRIIALPGETFKIEKSQLYVYQNGEYTLIPYTFKISPDISEEDTTKDIGETTLGADEYWVLGDHRNKSRDSGTLNKPIKKDYILGVLVAIEGQAKLKVKKYVCPVCGKSYKGGNICECGGSLSPEYDLVNKQYHWPKYY